MKIPATWTFRNKEVADAFDSHVREQLPWYDLATGIVVHVARHYVSTGGGVYDVGASTGNIGKAIQSVLTDRTAWLVAIEASEEMAARYSGPGSVQVADAVGFDYGDADLIISFLTMMFIPIAKRRALVERWKAALTEGGAIVLFDKAVSRAGYIGTVLSRLTLAAKYEQGATADEIIQKELSLAGVQRPVSDLDVAGFVEIFRFGDFAGWLYEKGGPEAA